MFRRGSSLRDGSRGSGDWKRRIVELAKVKQDLADADSRELWEHRLPAVAATPEQLETAETILGEALDPSYRCFLSYANGWAAFFQAVDLFGTDDLIGGQRFRHAVELIADLDDVVLTAADVRRDEIYPIASSRDDIDVFVIKRRRTADAGAVIWFATHEVDRFTNFDEYFASMVQYNRLEARSLSRGERTAGGSRPR
jgi:hypothetical protein